jgi:hypothetical protein
MEPIDKLKLMTAWDVEPALSEEELEAMMADNALEDAAGLPPSHEEWTPTYDLNASAAEGWLMKAARAAATVDEPSAGVVTSKIFDNCRAMARIYTAKRKFTVAITR